METLAIELLESLGITRFTDRHLQIVINFLENKDKVKKGVSCIDTCEAFLTQLGEHTSSDLQKVQGFVEANFC